MSNGTHPARTVLTTVGAGKAYAGVFPGNTAENSQLNAIARDKCLAAMKPAFWGNEGIFGAALHCKNRDSGWRVTGGGVGGSP